MEDNLWQAYLAEKSQSEHLGRILDGLSNDKIVLSSVKGSSSGLIYEESIYCKDEFIKKYITDFCFYKEAYFEQKRQIEIYQRQLDFKFRMIPPEEVVNEKSYNLAERFLRMFKLK